MTAPGEAQGPAAARDERLRYHIGRSWTGTRLEDVCPCPKEPCGLVDAEKALESCEQGHHWNRARTIRQSHRSDECPGVRHAD